jgi:hypothetical protein
MIHLRTLTYTTTKAKLETLKTDQQFLDMAEVGSLLNAIVHACGSAPWQLASFTSDRKPENAKIYISGGFIYDSILLSKRIIDRYKDRFGPAYLLREYYERFTVYSGSGVVVGPWQTLPFGVHRKKDGLLLRVDNRPGFPELLPLAKDGEGFEFATVLADDAFRKRGQQDATLGTLIDDAVEEFVYATEDFIAHTANRSASQPQPTLTPASD